MNAGILQSVLLSASGNSIFFAIKIACDILLRCSKLSQMCIPPDKEKVTNKKNQNARLGGVKSAVVSVRGCSTYFPSFRVWVLKS